MAERSSAQLVGSISLFKTDWEARSSEVGYGVRPDRRGRGYASEAVVALARWALTEGGMQRIQLCAIIENAPHVFTETFAQHRYVNVPMETRGLVAQWDVGAKQLEVVLACQGVHDVRASVDALKVVEAWSHG